jgi:single-strand DNA-binding protein
MARGLNKVMLIGHLGKDPEMRFTQSGMAVANFTMATSEVWTDKATNDKKERTEWHRIVAFGKLGEICGQYLAKGKQVYIEGRLQTRSWDQDGVTRYTTEIVANDMQMLDSKGAGAGSGASSSYNNQSNYSNQPSAPQAPSSNSGGMQPGPPDNFDDDIPF